MKSLLMWVGVLGASVALGVGLYGLAMRPAEAADSDAAAGQPSSTIYRLETRVVEDPAQHRVVETEAPGTTTANGRADDRATSSADATDDDRFDDGDHDDDGRHDSDRDDDADDWDDD